MRYGPPPASALRGCRPARGSYPEPAAGWPLEKYLYANHLCINRGKLGGYGFGKLHGIRGWLICTPIFALTVDRHKSIFFTDCS